MPLLNLSQVVQRFAQNFFVKRRTKGTYDSYGRYQPGDTRKYKSTGSVQVMTPREIMHMFGTNVSRETIKIYTNECLATGNQVTDTEPDVVEWRGRDYEVAHISDWECQGGYYKVAAMLVQR